MASGVPSNAAPSGQSGLAPIALGRQGAPSLEVELLREMYRQLPDGVLQSRCRNGQLDGRAQFIHGTVVSLGAQSAAAAFANLRQELDDLER